MGSSPDQIWQGVIDPDRRYGQSWDHAIRSLHHIRRLGSFLAFSYLHAMLPSSAGNDDISLASLRALRYHSQVDGRIYSPNSALSSRSRDPIFLDFPSDRNERVISHSMTLSRVVEPGLYPLERTLSYSSGSRNPIFVLI
jgi:hypothetical protein